MTGQLPIPLQDAPIPGTPDVLGGLIGVPLVVIRDAIGIRTIAQTVNCIFVIDALDQTDPVSNIVLTAESADSSAVEGTDYTFAGPITYDPFTGQLQITVPVIGTPVDDDLEFLLTISSTNPLFIARATAVGRILGKGNIRVYDAGVYATGVYDPAGSDS